MSCRSRNIFQAVLSAAAVACCLGTLQPGQHGRLNELPSSPLLAMDLESGLEYEAIQPAVIGKVMPVFFERASKVVIQLVKDNLSKAKLGDLETYTDGETRPSWLSKRDGQLSVLIAALHNAETPLSVERRPLTCCVQSCSSCPRHLSCHPDRHLPGGP